MSDNELEHMIDRAYLMLCSVATAQERRHWLAKMRELIAMRGDEKVKATEVSKGLANG